MALDLDKFKRLFHYVVWKAGKRPHWGAVKTYKVLWFSDAGRYAVTGKSITGETYVRQKYGPMPKHAVAARQALVAEKSIQYTPQRSEFDGAKFQALVIPQMSGFSTEDLQTVDYWIEHIDRDHTATSISEESHDYGWEIAAMGEELPLHAALASRIRDLTPDERDRAIKRAKELGLI